jgi:GT2 family glycosyltransferase
VSDARIVGIGILSYGQPRETARLVASIINSTPHGQYQICIFDNTDTGRNVWDSWYGIAAPGLPAVSLLASGVNVGCSVARNKLWEHFRRTYPEMQYMVILDQDIVVRPGWLSDMLEVADSHPDAGQVVWPAFNMARDQPDAEGRIHDVAGGASLYRMSAVQAVGGWESRFFFYRFDSWFTLQCYAKGWYTYLITKYGTPDEDWSTWLDRYGGKPSVDCGPLSHVNPSQGTKRHPAYHKIRAESQALFENLLQEHGLNDLYKNWPNHKDLHEQENRNLAIHK